MITKTNCTIIIPAYNEYNTIESVLNNMLKLQNQYEFEIIVVNDGSTDNTQDILKKFGSQIKVITHFTNKGYGASLKDGIRNTRTKYVMFFDADGQHDINKIPEFLNKLETTEMLIGERVFGDGSPKKRLLGKIVLNVFVNFITAKKVSDVNCGMRAGIRHLYMEMLDILPDGFSFTTTSLVYTLKNRLAYEYIPVKMIPRHEGFSTVNMFYDGTKTIMLIFRLAMLFNPFKVFGGLAGILFLIAIIYQAYIFARTGLHIEAGSIITSIIAVVLLSFGVIADQISALRQEISTQSSLFRETMEKLKK
jgi:glycosyltransferase involved in cell wall biosynthesis